MSRAKDRLVILEQFGTTKNEFDEEVEAWTPVGGGEVPTAEWATVYFGRGDERRQAASEQASQSATFRMHLNERTRVLTSNDRLLFEGTWDIHGVAHDTPNRGEIEVTATKQA